MTTTEAATDASPHCQTICGCEYLDLNLDLELLHISPVPLECAAFALALVPRPYRCPKSHRIASKFSRLTEAIGAFGGRTPPAKWVRLRTMIGGGAQVDHVSSGSAWKFNFGFRSCLTGRYWRQIRCRTDRRSWRSVVRRKSMPPAASCNPRRLGKHFCEGA